MRSPVQDVILHPNAAPVYEFLARIDAQESAPRGSRSPKILDCGAGGRIPPLALFSQRGFQAFGIDISADELERARVFGQQHALDLDLRQGDMRRIPFEDQHFDFVFEHFSICHLSKADTAVAVREMRRVLRPGGLCFLGFISTDTWPRSLFGEQRAPGEFYGEEAGVQNVLHSMLDDAEADNLVASWDLLEKKKSVQYLREAAVETSRDEWIRLHAEAGDGSSAEDWDSRYEHRSRYFQYTHLYYFLRRPA